MAAFYQKLSEQVNLTARPCLERVRLLERAVLSVVTVRLLSYRNLSMLLLSRHKFALADHGHSQAAFEQEVRKTPEVLDCWLVGGSFDFLVRIGCRNMSTTDYWLTPGSPAKNSASIKFLLPSPSYKLSNVLKARLPAGFNRGG